MTYEFISMLRMLENTLEVVKFWESFQVHPQMNCSEAVILIFQC